ncbi:DUF488 domain-containing protein [Longitalea arenae]|uniref:DUF488 domain-containing protein n=1 Tax=Longitalea arenae TaxID=2812558 RepID=UPI0019687D00|nr:DUF488 domain-containing protein [Longitalea arenae]
MSITIKRIYEPVGAKDGYRVLVDRLWPRGISKEEAHVDTWLKEVAPSTELRKWFHNGEGSFAEFKKKYLAELKQNPALQDLRSLYKEHKKLTLLYAAKDEEQNHAQILAELLGS